MEESSVPTRAYLYLMIAALGWGGNAVVGKLAVGHASPMMLTFWRWVLAVAIITAISVPQLIKDRALMRKHWLLLLGYGAVGYTAFNALLYSALQYTTAINAAIEQAAIPLAIFAANFLLFRLKASWAQMAGFALTLVGVAVTASHGDVTTLLSLSLNFGDGLMMLCVLAYTVYTIGLRWKPPLHWKSLMAGPALGALLTSIPLMLWEMSRDATIWPDATGWGIIAYISIFPSLISQILYIEGVERIGANRAGLFINMVPVFGTLLSIAIIGERLEPFHILAMALVIAGIAIAERGKPAR